MKPTKTWIVIADAHHVRIAVNEGPGKGLYGHGIAGLTPPKVSELSDAPGMTNAPNGPNRGSISDPDLKKQAEAAYADQIAGFLDVSLQTASFDRFVLVAAPEMLGLLRQRLSPQLSKTLYADIPKDLTHVPLDDMPPHLADVMVV